MENKIEIETGIAPPRPRGSAVYPQIEQLEIGQSFSVPKAEADRLRNCASNETKRLGRKFITATDPQDKERKRVWRVADPVPEAETK